MPDLVIKPTAGPGNKLILQDQGGDAILTSTDGKGFIVGKTATAPSSPAVGQMFFDTTLNALRIYNGTSWERVISHGGSASGGTETDSGGYRYHTFTTGGSLVVSGTGTSTLLCDILVVGAGGGSGYWGGCGGGGGSVYERLNFQLSSGTHTVIIGGGGASKQGSGGGAAGTGTNGGNSLFGPDHIGFGGGGGGCYDSNGLDGGCGGGRDSDTAGDTNNPGKGITTLSASTVLNTHTLTNIHKSHSHSSSPTRGDGSAHNGSGAGGAGGLNGTWSSPNMSSPGHGGHGGIGKYISWVDHLAGTNAINGLTGTLGYFGGGGHGLSSNTLDTVPGGADETGMVNTGGGANGDKLTSGGSGIVIVRYAL